MLFLSFKCYALIDVLRLSQVLRTLRKYFIDS